MATKKLTDLVKAKLTTTLRTIGYKYPDINSGGCGLMAKLLYEVFKSKGYHVRLILTLGDERSTEAANFKLRNNQHYDLHLLNWNHILIKVDGHYIDTLGVFESLLTRYYYDRTEDRFGVVLPMKILDEWLNPNLTKRWNPTFDKAQMPLIEKDVIENLQFI